MTDINSDIDYLSDDDNFQYVLIYKERDNILDDIEFTEEERVLCDSIIDNLERFAFNAMNHDKCIAIPFLGTIEKHWSKSAFKEHYKEFQEVKKTSTREEYDSYVQRIMSDARKERLDREHKIKTMRRFKNKMLPKWNNLVNKKGVAYANFWLYSITHFDVIEFDEEIQEIYERFGY